jgi:hypothetical protein
VAIVVAAVPARLRQAAGVAGLVANLPLACGASFYVFLIAPMGPPVTALVSPLAALAAHLFMALSVATVGTPPASSRSSA